MQDDELKDLKKYVCPNKLARFFFGGLTVILLVLCVYFMLFGKDAEMLIITIVSGIVMFGLIFAYVSQDYLIYIKKMKIIEQQGNMPVLLFDFKNGGPAFNDYLRVGGRYLIGKKTGTMVSYDEIARIYQYVHQTNFVEDSRMLKVKTTNGKTYSLCRLPLKGKADDEVNHVISYILSVNGNVQVGYKK